MVLPPQQPSPERPDKFTNAKHAPELLLDDCIARWSDYVNSHGSPDAVVIEATSYCNVNTCGLCYICNPNLPGKAHANPRTIANFTEAFQTTNSCPDEIWLAGGEPTVNPELPSILDTIHTKLPKTPVHLVTNGIRLADPTYAQVIAKHTQPGDGVDITLGENETLHNLSMIRAEDKAWKGIADRTPADLVRDGITQIGRINNWGKSFEAVVAVTKAMEAAGKEDVSIGLNFTMNSAMNLTGLIKRLQEVGGRVDNVIFQVFQPIPNTPSHRSSEWLTPTSEMVKAYLEQAQQLIDAGLIMSAVIIDPLPDGIVAELNLKDEPRYQPCATPAISVEGEVYPDVVTDRTPNNMPR